MKRGFPFNSDGNKNGDIPNKQWCPPTSSANSSLNPATDLQAQNSLRNQINDPQRSEAAALPTTSTQSFPWFTNSFNRGTEMFNSDSNQNPYMMPFGRNVSWPDNRMFGMPLSDPNMAVNSSAMLFPRNEETMNAENRREVVASGSSTDNGPARSESPLPSFTADEVDKVNEMLKEKNTLRQGLKVLIGWLKRGDCTKTNNNDFADMIKYAHNQVWRLMSEKTEVKEELNEEKREISRCLSGLASQFEEIMKVLEVAKLQKVWDQFTKPQRKQLGAWREEALQLKSQILKQQDEDDEDGDDLVNNKSPENGVDPEKEELKKEYLSLKDQLDNLQDRLKVVENENDKVQKDDNENIRLYKISIKDMEERCTSLDEDIENLKKFKKEALESIALKESEAKKMNQPKLCPAQTFVSGPFNMNIDGVEITEKEVFLLTLISTFLYVHPFGASIDYICSYLIKIAPDTTDTRYVESLLRKFPNVFKEELHGIGASLVKSWIFLGFKDGCN